MATLIHQLLYFFQASIPDRSHYRPGWQRNPTLVKMHEKYKEGNVLNGSRIVGGTEVIPHSFPHQVAMFIDGSFFCGGSLICKHRYFCACLKTSWNYNDKYAKY